MPRPTAAERNRLLRENEQLRRIASDLQIMAKRYADGRSTSAPGTVNEHTETLLDLGVTLNPGGEGTVWAQEGTLSSQLGPEWIEPGGPVALGRVFGLSAGTRLSEKLTQLLGTERIDEAVERVMELLERCGELEPHGGG